MWQEPTLDELLQLPQRGSTDKIPLAQRIVHMHFCTLQNSHWYAIEYDRAEEKLLTFAVFCDRLSEADWKWVSLEELKNLDPIEYGGDIGHDNEWTARPVADIRTITRSYELQSKPISMVLQKIVDCTGLGSDNQSWLNELDNDMRKIDLLDHSNMPEGANLLMVNVKDNEFFCGYELQYARIEGEKVRRLGLPFTYTVSDLPSID